MERYPNLQFTPTPKPNMCSICDVLISSPAVAEFHYKGQKHLKNLEKQEERNGGSYYCEYCQIVCTGKSPYQEHCKSKKHLQKCPDNTGDMNSCDMNQFSSSGHSVGFVKQLYSSVNEMTNSFSRLSFNNQSSYNKNTLLIKINSDGQAKSQAAFDASNTIVLDDPCQIMIKQHDKMYRITIHKDKFDLQLQSLDQSSLNVTASESRLSGEEKTNLTSDSSNDVKIEEDLQDLPLECDICKKSFNGQLPALGHFKSSSHIKKKKLLEESTEDASAIYCKLCNVKVLDEKQMAIHLESQKHRKILMKDGTQNSTEQFKPNAESYPENSESPADGINIVLENELL